jgi:hypothetical protein
MIEQIPLDIVNLLIFTVPGFFLVRSYKGASAARKYTDFEYLALSLFWGIIFLAIFSKFFPSEKFNLLIDNPYAGAVAFSVIAMVLGFCAKEVALLFRSLQK